MNERIKELYKQALMESVDVAISQKDPLSDNVIVEKFAELIVRECADVCQDFGESGDGYTCSYEILEHFGVE